MPPVVIKDGAFIGAHTIVLKGVTIGERSIVGAGSVVSRSIQIMKYGRGILLNL